MNAETVRRHLTICALLLSATILRPTDLHAQFVDDGSDRELGQADTRLVLELIGKQLRNPTDAKVTSLRRASGSWICGSVNEKNRDGLYLGERGFVVDRIGAFFGRVPEGPELMNPRVPGFAEKERIRQLYFDMCLD